MIILKSLTITIVIAFLLAYGLQSLFGFWQAFSLSVAVQIIGSFIYSSIKISREQEIVDVYQQEIDSLLDLSRVIVECPCGKNKFEDVMFIGQDNIFDCDVCGSKFKADVKVTPTLLTEPVDVETTFDELIKKQKEL